MNGDEVGKISKQWSGLAREMFTDADFFGINFPMDLDVRMKAVMLGACFLIDAMFFEKVSDPEDMRSELNCIWNWFIFLCHTYFRVKTKSKTAQECFKIFQSSSMTIKREKNAYHEQQQ